MSKIMPTVLPADTSGDQQRTGAEDGHHYYFQRTSFKDEMSHDAPHPLWPGFTVRIYIQAIDSSGNCSVSLYRKDANRDWYLTSEVSGGAIRAQSSSVIGRRVTHSQYQVVPKPGDIYSLAVRVTDGSSMVSVHGGTYVAGATMQNIFGHQWTYKWKTSNHRLLSMHLVTESVKTPDRAWGRNSYFNKPLPTGSVAIYTCKLVDKSKPNSIQLTQENGVIENASFNHANKAVNSQLRYFIRLSPLATLVSTDFDPSVVKLSRPNVRPNYIRPMFAESVYIVHVELDITP